MSGHNKWSQIKHKKAKEDSKRGKAFTKLIKEITVCAKEGGGDPAANARLRTLIEKAKEINMPLDNITRAVKRGSGELPGVHYDPYTYEGYGPYGIAVLVETLSDNKNRTVADMRHLFSKHGGSLGESGSVNWMFKRLGVIRGTGKVTEDQLLEALMDYPIVDISCQDNFISVSCDLKSLDVVKNELKKLGVTIDNADIEWVAQNTIQLSEEQSNKAIEFLSQLEDHDDVQSVYTNLA